MSVEGEIAAAEVERALAQLGMKARRIGETRAVVALAAAAEARSEHPLARAILRRREAHASRGALRAAR
jgi:cation transport ATPase